jgi:hypothetical protein
MRVWKLIVMSLLLLYGCQGSSRHEVVTGGQGSLEGLLFLPPDHSRDVDVDTDPEIFWLPGYEPPAKFTVSLKRIDEYGDYQSVGTELNSSGTNRWKLKVTGTLNEGTLYAIIVRDDTRGEIRESWFLTEKSRVRSPNEKAKNSETFEHTIILSAPTQPK